MFDVLIAEQDQENANIIKDHINNHCNNFMVTQVAYNGEDALHKVLTYRPNILIVDISLPFLDGFCLTKKVQDAGIPVIVIAVSDQKDFDMIKKSMLLGIRDFLVKPISLVEIESAFLKLEEELFHQTTLKKNMENMQNQLQLHQIYREEHFLRKIINGTIDESMDIEQIIKENELSIDFSGHTFCAGMFHLSQSYGYQKKMNLTERLMTELFPIIKSKYFSGFIKCYAFLPEEDRLVIVLCSNCKSEYTFHRLLLGSFTKINESLERYYHICLVGVLGRVYNSWEGLRKSYQDSVVAARGMLDFPEQVISYRKYQKIKAKYSYLVDLKPEELEKQLLVLMQTGQQKSAYEKMQEIFYYFNSQIEEDNEKSTLFFLNMYYHMNEILKSAGAYTSEMNHELSKKTKEVIENGSLQEVRNYFLDFLDFCFKQLTLTNKKNGDQLIQSIKYLIDANLGNEDLCLESIAVQLHFSTNYIRQIFKQRTGQGFIDYVQKKRMEQAKKMLQIPTEKIKDIALKSGYSNQRYFSSSFKRWNGCTPSEYRKIILR